MVDESICCNHLIDFDCDFYSNLKNSYLALVIEVPIFHVIYSNYEIQPQLNNYQSAFQKDFEFVQNYSKDKYLIHRFFVYQYVRTFNLQHKPNLKYRFALLCSVKNSIKIYSSKLMIAKFQYFFTFDKLIILAHSLDLFQHYSFYFHIHLLKFHQYCFQGYCKAFLLIM